MKKNNLSDLSADTTKGLSVIGEVTAEEAKVIEALFGINLKSEVSHHCDERKELEIIEKMKKEGHLCQKDM